MRARWVIAASTAILALTARAQDGPLFEVSPASPDSQVAYSRTPWRTPQVLSFEAAYLPSMIAFAYERQVDPSEGLPQWISNSRYDVAVTTTNPTSLPEQRRLLQKLLEERFRLVTRRVSYHTSALFLVQGPKVNLTPSKDPTAAVPDSCRSGLGSRLFNPLGPPLPVQDSPCVGPTTMNGLAIGLSMSMQTAVLDKTGISGVFDIYYGVDAPDYVDDRISVGDLRQWSNLPRLCLPGPCVQDYTRWLNRFGLKLELHSDVPMESLVIDHIEEPSGI